MHPAKAIARAIAASGLIAQIGFGPAARAQNIPLNYTNNLPIMAISASQVCSGISFYDINGTAQIGTKSCGPPPDCSSNGAVGCVTTASYKSADFTTILASNIKRGVGIGGVTGNYPSATTPLPRYSDGATTATIGNDETDLTNFQTQVTSPGTFEYWDSSGIRRAGSGSANIVAGNIKNTVAFENLSVIGTYTGPVVTPPNAWDVRAGIVVGGVTGKLKVNCRNAVRLSSFDNTTSPAATGSDIWDTIDDYYGLPASTNFPPTWSVANNYCGGVEATAGDNNVWKDVTTTDGVTESTCSVTPGNCTMQDKISGLKWSNKIEWYERDSRRTDQFRLRTTATWGEAVTRCSALFRNGVSGWRLPTEKELTDAYNHGISSAARTDANWITLANMQVEVGFWSASSDSASYKMSVNFAEGTKRRDGMSSEKNVVCVHDSSSNPLIAFNKTKYSLVPYQENPITPTWTAGELTDCTTSPTLPTGLWINSTNCVISGTPYYVSAETIYTITATKSGKVQAQGISIQVNYWQDVTTTGSTTLTMKDTRTGLKWSNRRPDSATVHVASNHCDNLVYNNSPDWRLPTKTEMVAAYTNDIINADRANWMTQADMNNYFWSSTYWGYNSNYGDMFWIVGFVQRYSTDRAWNNYGTCCLMVVCVQ